MKRIGYVGLSTPIFYDYRNPANKTANDASSSPNPIVEGAFGALLLYDELWFLCRSLCPENMRDLSYVKFMDELGTVPDIDPHWLQAPDQLFDPIALATFSASSSAYGEVKRDANVYWDAAADNHTHTLKIGELELNGNSWNVKNVIFDMHVVDTLTQEVELITNSFTSRLFKTEASVRDKLVLSELLVLDSVPQFLTPKGPYHPSIEEVRHSSYLENFRGWIRAESQVASVKTVQEVKQEVEAKLRESQRSVFLKHLSPVGSYLSVANTMLGVGLDCMIPGAGSIKDLVSQFAEEKKKQGLRWQGFILESRVKLESLR
jgi:hypothetical protein